MADRYVYSGAAGAGTGADWANAHTTFAAAITAGAAGDTYYVAHDHAESTAGAVTLAFPGSDAAPDHVLCVNRAGTVPPVAADIMTGASVATSGGASTLTITGNFYCYGVAFTAGTGGTNTCSINLAGSAVEQRYEACHFKLASSGTASRMIPGAISSVVWNNCTAEFSATAQGFTLDRNHFRWYNKPGSTAIVGATLPTTLMVALSQANGEWYWSGLDLSALDSGKTLLGAGNSVATIRLVNCKLGASVTIAATPNVRWRKGIEIIGCDSGATVSRNERYRYDGTLTTETTIVRTGGATDGTTPYSWKVVTTANSKRTYPFETFEGAVWNEDTGVSKTLTVHTVTDNVTLTDAEIWLEVEYLGDATAPVASFASDAPATVLTAGANQTTSTETWTTTGLGTPVKQQLEVTFTPNMIGPIRWRVKVAKASTTVYICPKPEIA